MYTSLSWFSDQTKDATPRVLVLGHPALHKPLFYIFWTYISTTMISVIFWYHGLIYCLELCFLTPYCDIKPFGSSTLSVFPLWQPAGLQADNISSSLQLLTHPLLGCQYDNLTVGGQGWCLWWLMRWTLGGTLSDLTNWTANEKWK